MRTPKDVTARKVASRLNAMTLFERLAPLWKKWNRSTVLDLLRTRVWKLRISVARITIPSNALDFLGFVLSFSSMESGREGERDKTHLDWAMSRLGVLPLLYELAFLLSACVYTFRIRRNFLGATMTEVSIEPGSINHENEGV